MRTFYSPSKLESYSKCPKSHKESTFEDNDATKFGDAVHKSIESFLLGGKHPMESFIEFAGLAGLPALSDEMKDKAKACFAALSGSSKLDINPDLILSVETSGIPEEMSVTYNFPAGKKKFFQVPMNSEWGLRGSMDFADVLDDGTLRIVDWKTGLSQPGDDLQLACYALAAWKIFPGFEKIQTGFFFLEQGGKYEYSTWDEHTLVGAFNYISKIVQTMSSEKKWGPKLNKYCGYCSIKDSCDLYKQTLKKPVVESEWKYEPVADNLPVIIERYKEISSLKKIVDGIEKELNEARKTILKTSGPSVVGDKEYYLNEYASSYEYDVAKIFASAEEITGRQPYEIFKLDSGAYDEFIAKQDDEEVKKALRKIKKDCGLVKGYSAKISEKIAKNPEPLNPEPLPETKVEENKVIINGGPLKDQSAEIVGEGMTSGTTKVLVDGDTIPVNISNDALTPVSNVKIFVCTNCAETTRSEKPWPSVTGKCSHCNMEGVLILASDEKDAMYKMAELRKRKSEMKSKAALAQEENKFQESGK